MNQRKTPSATTSGGFGKTRDTLGGVLKGEVMIMPHNVVTAKDLEEIFVNMRVRYAPNATFLVMGDKIVAIQEGARLALRKEFVDFAAKGGRVVVLIATDQNVVGTFRASALNAKLEFQVFVENKSASEFCQKFRKQNPIYLRVHSRLFFISKAIRESAYRSMPHPANAPAGHQF